MSEQQQNYQQGLNHYHKGIIDFSKNTLLCDSPSEQAYADELEKKSTGHNNELEGGMGRLYIRSGDIPQGLKL